MQYLSDNKHEGIVNYAHVREFDNYFILGLELAEGGSLEKLLR